MKKRILSLLLAVVMIASMLPAQHVHAADDCIYLKYYGSHSYSYSYTDNGDGTHYQKCSGCDARSAAEEHTWGSWRENFSDGNHYRQCTKCGAKQTGDHTMSYKQGSYVGYHVYGCTVCSYTEGNSYGTPCASSTWLKTDAEHYKKCDTCGLEFARESHSGSVTNNGASGHTIGCSTCGKGVTENHTMGNWTSGSGDQHTRTCTVNGCDYTEKENHSLKYTGTDGSERHTVACKVCNYSRSNVSCSFGNNYVQGDTQHWKVCTLCNTKGTMTNHSGTVQKIDGDSTHHKVTCSTCKKVAVVECTFGSWQNAGNGKHEATCTEWNCRNTKSEAHTLQYTGTDNYDYHSVGCKTCNYTQSSEKCTFGNYVQGDTQHWKVCSVCNTKGTLTNHKNTTTDNKNGTHTTKCTDCGKSTTKAHTMGQWQNDSYNNQHKRTCKDGCGYTETANHTPMYSGADGNTTHKVTCKDCNTTIAYSENCTYSGSYEKNDAQHWQVCSVCNTKGTMTKHSGDVTSNGSTGHTISCDTCDKSTSEAHTLSNWANDNMSDQHKRSCTVNGCDYTETADHGNWTYEQYSSSQHKKSCGVCGDYEYENCTKQYTDNNDGSTHTAKCNDCGKTVTNEQHSYDSNTKTCKCGAVRHDHAWKLVVSGNKITLTCTETVGTCIDNLGELTITAPANLTYDGNAKEAVVAIASDSYMEDNGSYSISYQKKNGDYYSSVSEVKGAGQYRATVTYSLGFYGPSEKATVDFTVQKASLTVTAQDKTVAYDGNEYGITVTGLEGTGLKVYFGEAANACNSTSYTKSDAGEYEIFYEVRDDFINSEIENYDVEGKTGSAKLTITQVSLADAVKVTPYSGTYDGKAHGITVEVPDDADVYYSENGTDWSSWPNQNPTYTDVGTYTVYYKVVSKSGNYFAGKARAAEVSVEGSSTVEIKVLNLADVLTVTAKDTEFTFNRNTYTDGVPYVNHSIELTVDKTQVPGTYDNITIEYSKDGGATWTSQNPAFRDAGEYTVKYRIYVKDYNYSAPDYMDDNYLPIEGSNKVTIHKAELPFDALHGYRGPYDGLYHYTFSHVEYHDSGWGYTYWTTYWWLDDLTYEFSWTDDNGAARTTTVTGKDNFINYYDGKVPMFRKQNVSSLSGSEPGKVVTVTISGDNYITETFTYNVKIGPGLAVAKDTEYDYDGNEHYIANYIAGLLYRGYGDTYNFGSIKIEYREKGSTEWLPASQEPGQTDVGSKDVEWRVTMDSDGNGEFGEESNSFGSREVFTGTNKVTVNAVPLTVTANNNTITYGDEPAAAGATITGYVNGEDGDDVGASNLTFEFNYNKGDNAGTYTITPKGLTPKNYTVTYVPGTLTVNKKPVTIVLDETTGEPKVDPADLVSGDTCTVDEYEYYQGETKLDAAPTKPGTYKIKVIKLGNDNYEPENDVEFTIDPPAPPALPKLTVTAKDHTITYGDAPANNGVTINPDDDPIDLAGLAYDYDYAQGNNVGTYAITPKGLDSEKYDVTYVAGVLTVEQKPVTILIDDSVSLLDLADQIPQLKVDPEDLVGDDECQVVKVEYYSGDTKLDGAPTAPGTYRIKVIELSNDNYYPENDVEFTIVDEAPPTGNINVTTNNWNSYLTSVDFDIYFNEGKTVTITAADDIAVQSIEYYVLNASSGTHKTLAQLAAMTDGEWSDYTGAFSIIPNQKVVVYAKITDNSANVTYICSDGMIFDGTAPVIDGIKNGKSYKDGAEFTVTDNFALDKVTIDGKEVEPNEDGEYIIKKDNKKHTVIATDKAGNEVKLTIISGVLKTEDAVTPATGDNFNFGLIAFAMIASVAALAVLVIGKRRSTGKK